jgi:hypothetical protein
VGLGVAEAVFSSQLVKNVVKYAPGAPLDVVEQSPSTMRAVIPADLLDGVIRAYVKSLDAVFIIGVPLSAFFFRPSLFSFLVHEMFRLLVFFFSFSCRSGVIGFLLVFMIKNIDISARKKLETEKATPPTIEPTTKPDSSSSRRFFARLLRRKQKTILPVTTQDGRADG